MRGTFKVYGSHPDCPGCLAGPSRNDADHQAVRSGRAGERGSGWTLAGSLRQWQSPDDLFMFSHRRGIRRGRDGVLKRGTGLEYGPGSPCPRDPKYTLKRAVDSRGLDRAKPLDTGRLWVATQTGSGQRLVGPGLAFSIQGARPRKSGSIIKVDSFLAFSRRRHVGSDVGLSKPAHRGSSGNERDPPDPCPRPSQGI